MHMPAKQAAEEWIISDRCVRIVYVAGKFRELPVGRNCGRFHLMQRHQRVPDISPRKVYLR